METIGNEDLGPGRGTPNQMVRLRRYPLLVDDKPAVMARLRARGVETIDFWQRFHPACDPAQFPEVAHG